MKHCKHCGAQLADDDTYCYFCGANLEEEVEKVEAKTFDSYGDNYNDNYAHYHNQTNTLAVVGFVMAFLSPIVGLVLSILGLNRARVMKGVGRKMAVAGIIVAIANFIITFVIYFLYAAYLYAEEGGA